MQINKLHTGFARNKVSALVAALFATLFGSTTLMAQSTNLGSYSPYTMYGLGELHAQGTLYTRSMGGAGVAMRTMGAINLLNPAAQSTAIPKSVIFNFGVDGGGYHLSQYSGSELKTTAYNTFNIRDLAFQLPITKGLGVAVSVTPYSSIGYNITGSEKLTDVGAVSYTYNGEGSLTEARFAIGYEPFKSFSIGASARYIFGNLNRTYVMSPTVIIGEGVYSSTIGSYSYDFSKVAFQVGTMWSPINNRNRVLTIGATYDFGTELNPTVTNTVMGNNNYITIIAQASSQNLPLTMPTEGAAGLFYQTAKWTMVADYVFRDWGEHNTSSVTTANGMQIAYNNTNTFKLGAEYIPSRNDIRKYYRRMAYRLGGRYGDYYQSYNGTNLKEYAVTAGVSLPVRYGSPTKVDIGVEYGSLGNTNKLTVADTQVGLIKQQYIKLSVGLTLFGEDYWFQRPKYD